MEHSNKKQKNMRNYEDELEQLIKARKFKDIKKLLNQGLFENDAFCIRELIKACKHSYWIVPNHKQPTNDKIMIKFQKKGEQLLRKKCDLMFKDDIDEMYDKAMQIYDNHEEIIFYESIQHPVAYFALAHCYAFTRDPSNFEKILYYLKESYLQYNAHSKLHLTYMLETSNVHRHNIDSLINRYLCLCYAEGAEVDLFCRTIFKVSINLKKSWKYYRKIPKSDTEFLKRKLFNETFYFQQMDTLEMQYKALITFACIHKYKRKESMVGCLPKEIAHIIKEKIISILYHFLFFLVLLQS